MSILPITFPTERERLRRLVVADRGLSVRERVQAIDGLLNFVEQFEVTEEVRATREKLELAKRAEKLKRLREFIRKHLATQAESLTVEAANDSTDRLNRHCE